MVGKKLYVGNLTYRVSSSDLEQLFSQFGSVESAEVISDRDTGRSKGFGFVEMSTDNEARAAIDALNEQEHDGRRLTVNEARPREPRTGGGGGGGGGVVVAVAAAAVAVAAAVAEAAAVTTAGVIDRTIHRIGPFSNPPTIFQPFIRPRGDRSPETSWDRFSFTRSRPGDHLSSAMFSRSLHAHGSTGGWHKPGGEGPSPGMPVPCP